MELPAGAPDELELLCESIVAAEPERRGDGGGRGTDGTRVVFEVMLYSPKKVYSDFVVRLVLSKMASGGGDVVVGNLVAI